MSKAEKGSPEQLSYEDARAQLADIVATLEAGDSTLEQALDLWERGEQLAAACTRWLDGAQARLDRAEDAATAEDAAVTDAEDLSD
ncbi:MAG: exodeoxyribonuclease VII small subunit [Actinobacteria bacterium]|nr:exodeoxyribonuclease VII small subunit [Actinomycetota bacterium]